MDLKDGKSYIYKIGITIISIIAVFSMILRQVFDGLAIEKYFKYILILTMILNGLLLGFREIFAEKNKMGYLYFLIDIVFIVFILNIYLEAI